MLKQLQDKCSLDIVNIQNFKETSCLSCYLKSALLRLRIVALQYLEANKHKGDASCLTLYMYVR